MKCYDVQHNIGHAKYVVNFYDGVTQHRDGSPFFNIVIFANKLRLAAFVANLKRKGYEEKGA